ncbi:uncharacterized protein GGS22DRAFT_185069 [Annulohypoxylon maeteangense]|uniref:uncharacterized protein n=1 Tax=Annulohypoxylon maeteangense TaxID=1927788 RepID=UPI0020087A39|nr:uncharacterized protein GGS22DRAFT_185069 [Annulohypoxylon maeteangense]KAI0887691.1 hypothetical protein GGS22DRAFT_185069 [Annulohypoxylon maeteangense]
MELATDLRGLSILNPSPELLRGPALLHDLVALSSNDGAPAVDYRSDVGDRSSLSYSELHTAAAALAARISDILYSLPPPDAGESLVIPILLPQSPALYIGLLAILKAGAAFCPLSLNTPHDRLRFILKDIRAKIVITDLQSESKLPVDGDAYRILVIDKPPDDSIREEARSTFDTIPEAEDLAYVMYTSGSTGLPKGVGVSHIAVTQSLLAHDRHIPAFARFLQFAAPTFDVSVFEIFFPLFRGRTLVCCDRADMLTDLPRILREMQIDACELTPSVAGSLLKKRSNAPSLRLLLTIGEMLTEPVIREFGGDENQESLLWGMYGPTEATIHCTLQPSFLKTFTINNIGVPLGTVSAFIIDADTTDFRVLPIEHSGELAVGGLQIASGYINRPKQTSAAFVDTRWGRIYRTGDKARMLQDGTIECLGRIGGGQVKLNGQRIELGEVEHALLRTPGCHSAFATVIANVLVAFAAVEESSEAARIRLTILSQCRSWLPAFMIPADVKIMNHFPLLPSGKVDKKTLIEYYEAVATHDPDAEEMFHDSLEVQLCEIAGAILGRPVAPSTRLPSLGLDSLSAIEYASMIRAVGVAVSPADILDSLTVRELSRLIGGRRDVTNALSSDEGSLALDHPERHLNLLTDDCVMRSHLDDVERVETCSPLQEAMVAETLKDARLYINQTELRFPSHLAIESIKSWFLALAQRNEILRTGFSHLNNKLYQVIWKQLREDQVDVLDHARPFQCVEVEHFLRHPFKLDIIPGKSVTDYHTVMMTVHHSIYDGWTIDMLIEDLSLLARGRLPIDRPQFRQVSCYFTAVPETDMMNAREFWAEHLRGHTPPALPNFRTTAVLESQIRTVRREIGLNPAVARDFALGATIGPQVLFQACLMWLWGAVCGADDVTIGSVSSGRTLPIAGIEKVMGPCVTTLPLRIIPSRYTTITELLQGIHAINRETLRYGSLPLAEIKRAAGIPLSQKPFDIIFAYQESLVSRRQGDNIVYESSHQDAVEAKLLIEILPLESHYSCQITWHSDAFSELQVDNLFRHLNYLVNYFTTNYNEPLGGISRSFPPERLSIYNEKPKRLKLLRSLSGLVERSASTFPTHDALCFTSTIGVSGIEARVLTYEELNSQANRIARYLRGSGVVGGGVIALVMEKSILMYCTILGILKSGCAYLPILPSTPLHRIRLILEQARTRICLIDRSSPLQPVENAPCSIIDVSCLSFAKYSDSNFEIPENVSDLAYVIYTSGTTGAPKGVSVTNANILSNIEVLSRIYPHEPSDRMLQACSQAFDMSVFEIFFSWGTGMCLCSAADDALFGDLENIIRALRVTHLGVTVTVASLLEPGRVPSVKFLVAAGEPMTDKVLETWADQLWQGYGPSETTNICTVRKVSRGDSSQYLGWSFENTSTFVFSLGTEELVPLGCVGELCFGGDQVAAGYLEMPELTAAKFFDHREYGRLYRSGDLGRMLPDGSLIILGRIDSQVKLRGLRIELQEIQAITLRSGFASSCTNVLVTVRHTSSQQLALFYVPAGYESTRFSFLPITDSTKQGIAMIRQELGAILPGYMVPSFVFPISALPLTSSGKVDHNLLSRAVNDLTDRILSSYSSTQDLDDNSAEWTETETLISEVISETLTIDRKAISRWISFATLGIDSISAMSLARRLQVVFQKRISLPVILSNPSVGRLASVISKAPSPIVVHPKERSCILPEWLVEATRSRFTNRGFKDVENVLPCTPLQEAMLSSISPSKVGSYCNQMLFRLGLPSQTMRKHWDMMFQRHGILRTCFVTTETPQHPVVQVVLKSYLSTWETIKVDKDHLQEHILRHGSSLPSALDSDQPPVSLAFFVLEDGTEFLSFVCHHAVYDGVSIRYLLSEVEAISRDEQLPTPLSFEPFLRETLSLPIGADSFWANHFTSFSPSHFDELPLQSDTESNVVSGSASGNSFSIVSRRLRDLGMSLLPLCQATWSITLSLLQDNNDVCFGNVVSGRSTDLDHIDTLVAPCFNTIPIRIKLSGMKLLHQVMKKFQQLNTDIMPYQFTSLRRIQSQLPVSRLFDTVLLLQPQSQPLDENIWCLVQENGAMDVPLVCEIIPLPEQDVLTLQLHRDPSIFTHQTLIRILDIFRFVFDACLEHPSSHLFTVPKLPARWQHDIAQISLTHETPQTDAYAAIQEQSKSNHGWTQTETRIRSVLSRLVKTPEDEIRRHTSIYRYGLDSIGAVQLANLLRRESFSVSAVDVIENPTCAGIASRMTSKGNDTQRFVYNFDAFQDAVTGDMNNIPKSTKRYEALLPCTPTQQGMISQFLSSKGAHYFNFLSVTLKPDLDPQQVVSAWVRLASRHHILRTGFITVNHQDTSYAMIVYPNADFATPVSILYQPNAFNDSEWRAEATSGALDALSNPPWQVVIVDHMHSPSTMHIAMHHALYDERSLQRLLWELTGVLSGNIEEEEPSPIRPALSACLDPVHSQPTSEAFWKGKAEDLVINKFPPMTPFYVTDRVESTVSKTCDSSSENLRHNAAKAGVTIRAALQAAWTRVLSAYLGEVCICFGIVLNGRNTKEEQDVIFPMVTTLPILACNSNSNSELLEYMMRYNTDMRRYERTPLPKVQRWLNRPNVQLFDTIIGYQTEDVLKNNFPWETLYETASLEYVAALEIVETISDRLRLNLTYDSRVLPPEQARILLQQFDAVFLDLLANPRGCADELPHRVPDLFSILPARCPELPSSAELLHQLVEQTARRIPSATALEFVEGLGSPIRRRSWTYCELNEMGNRVANMLLRHETPPGSIVATCFDKCPEAYFSILGILKAGCGFLSLDPGAPASRLEFILGDSAATCLLIGPGLSDSLRLNTTTPTYIINERGLSDFPASYQGTSQISSSDTCYCLYTSGTTGTPKGCLISHDNAVQAMLAFEQLFSGHWDARSRWLQFASFHFDVSVLEQYWSWFVGITLVAAPKDLMLSDIIATISILEITHIDLTPSLARLVHPEEVPSLCRGVFITGGEQLRQEILQVWGPKKVIYNAYGPTEATIGVTMFQRVPANGRSTNIGTQFPNVGTYVLEPGTETPILRGGVGELCVSGRLVGKGYLNRKDLTKERFPVLGKYKDRVYRTGDLVRVLHNGSFDFLGRADDQVKLRGQRLEIGEINHAIKTDLSNRLADVATFVTRHLGQERDLLVSFLAPIDCPPGPLGLYICSDHHSLEISRAALEACRGRLPGYMVPSYVLCVPFIPLSANNKADIKRLKSLFAELPHNRLRSLTAGSTTSHRALDEKECLISLAISNITGIGDTEILPSSSIFELGIDSINVARLAFILQSKGFARASASLILRCPQIDRLSQALQKSHPISVNRQALQVDQSIRAYYHRHIGMACRMLGINKADVDYIAPCTPLQEGMVTRSRTAEDRSIYFNQFQIELDTNVSIGDLKRCWDNIFEECAILRTAFLPTADGYIQVAAKRKAIPWFEISVGGKGIEDFALRRRELWVISNQNILRNSVEIDHFEYHGRQILLLRLFHAVYDGHSFELLLRIISSKYRKELPTRAPKFLDVLSRGPLLRHGQYRTFWEDVFRDHIFRPLPTLGTKLGASDVSISRVFRVRGLEARRIALRVTHQTMLQAAWLVTLSQRIGFVPTIGVVFSGRSLVLEGIEDVIGPVFNTLPFQIHSGYTTWVSLVRGIQEYNASVLECVHTPLRDIQKWCSNGQPLFDTLLAFDREDVFPREEAPLWTSVRSTGSLDYPLALEMVLSRDLSLAVNAAAKSSVATEDAVRLLLDELGRTLGDLASSNNDTLLPSGPISTNYSVAFQEEYHAKDLHILNASTVDRMEFFRDDKARKVRREVAYLADLADEDILENTSLLELGFDSIDAIKLATRLKRLELHITVGEIMKSPSIRSIVQSCRAADSNGTDDQDGMIRLMSSTTSLREYLVRDGRNLHDVVAILPPTPLQDSMVADMLLSSFHRYFNHDVLEISPSVDVDRLRSAWAIVYANSPILRTSFAVVDDPSSKTAFCQIVREEPLEVDSAVKLTSLDDIPMVIGKARDRAAVADGSSGLFQLTLVKTPANRYLVISVAHALYDGWSLELLHDDVLAAYEGRYCARRGYEPYLSHLLFSSTTAGESFWADYLDGVHPTLLQLATRPLKNRDPIIYRSELVSALNPLDLKALCQRYRVTPQVLAQGCWAPVLASITESLDVVFGVVLSGRDTDEAQGLLFPTMNTVPLRVVLHGTVTEYFNYLQATMSDIIGFQHFPLREVQKMANSTGGPLFNSLFLLQNVKKPSVRADPPIYKSVYTSSAVEYPLCIELEISETTVLWRVASDERYASLSDAQQILKDIDQIICYFSENHADILEFDQASEQVSVCGLKYFNLTNIVDNKVGVAPTDAPSFDPHSLSLESPVLDILSELSGVDKDNIDSNHSIYHLGLDSISAIKASSMLRKRGLEISVRDMLKAASIREIVNKRTGRAHSAVVSPQDAPLQLDKLFGLAEMKRMLEAAGVGQDEVESVLPALPVQVHMLSTWQNTDGLLFFPQFKYRMTGKINYEIVTNAWSKLVAENPLLRAHFAATKSEEIPFVQIIKKSRPIDSTRQISPEPKQTKWTYKDAATPFISICIDNSHLEGTYLYLRIHHALYDGISLSSIISRFSELCDNITAPSPEPCYARWYDFVSNHYSPKVRRQRQDFWSSYLRSINLVHLSALLGPITAGQRLQQVRQLRRGAKKGVSNLKAKCSTYGITLQALFFAAYSKTLAGLHRSNELSELNQDVVFGIYLANRTSFSGLEEAAFPTLNILPLLVRKPLARSVVGLAIDVQKDILEIGKFENASVGLWEIYDQTRIQIESSVNFLPALEDSITAYTNRNVTMTETTGQPEPAPDSNKPLQSLAQPSAGFTLQNKVRKAFLHTIDVEVAISGDAMDIGVFCPPSFSESDAAGLIDDLVIALEAVY